MECDILGGGNSNIFGIFTPILGVSWNPIWRAYFSNGLKPPTSGYLRTVDPLLLVKLARDLTRPISPNGGLIREIFYFREI